MMEIAIIIYLSGMAVTLMLFGFGYEKSTDEQCERWPENWPITVGLMWPFALPVVIGIIIAEKSK